ncbi:MAG: hypothetical protein EPO09_01255 [Aquabacterium sp.]|uniref:hypothetical protein n=1 Tax=Aquabacterium sp. TaxID=1872578 RepID=UPI001203F83C|nr:hypothetical protein [Aquabacterium sp.]TAK99356.1 MAG: hypothetical protein EPO09_01255 [Aquabacterium sp.]
MTVSLSKLLDPLHDRVLDGLEFARIAFRLFDEVYELPDDGKTLRERKGDVKPLLEEVLPIARFALAHYGQGQYLTVRWVRGSQPFDAKLVSHGGRVDHGMWPAQSTLEVTTAQHPNEYLMRERLNSEGGAFGLEGLTRIKGPAGAKSVASVPTVHSSLETINAMATLILGSIQAKAATNYPQDTTLIVNVELNGLYLDEEWRQLVHIVRERCPSHGFNAVFLCAGPGIYSTSL